MNIPPDLRYTRNDEWVRVEGHIGITGITDYAQAALADIVYAELPEIGQAFKQGEGYGEVESVKAAADLYLPLSGVITAVNATLKEHPEIINSDPYGEGWTVKFSIADLSELDKLMDAAAYEAYCQERQH